MSEQSFPALDLSDRTSAPAVDPLAALTAEVARTIPVPTVLIAVKARPGWYTRYRLNFEQEEIDSWRDTAKDRKGKVDTGYYNRLILANTCVAFLHDVDGERKVYETSDGSPVTFGLLAKQRECTVAEAVKFWLDASGQIEGTSSLVFVEAGYAGLPVAIEESGEDPTSG